MLRTTLCRWRKRRWPWTSRRQLQRLVTVTLCVICLVDMLTVSLTFIGESQVIWRAGVQSAQGSACNEQVTVMEEEEAAASVSSLLQSSSASLSPHSHIFVVGWQSTDAVVLKVTRDRSDIIYDVSHAGMKQWTNSDVSARFRVREDDVCRFEIDSPASHSLTLDDFRFVFVLGSQDFAAETDNNNNKNHNSKQIGHILSQLVCLFESLKSAKARITLVSTVQDEISTNASRSNIKSEKVAVGKRKQMTVANLTRIRNRSCLWQPQATSIYDTVLDIVFDLCLTYVHLYKFDFRIVAEQLIF